MAYADDALRDWQREHNRCLSPDPAVSTDDEFWNALMEDAPWLCYGDLDEHFAPFIQKVFSRPFDEWGLTPRHLNSETPDFQVAYWLFLSMLSRLDLYEYGTSPRGGWLTPKGERFKRILTEKVASGTLDWSPFF